LAIAWELSSRAGLLPDDVELEVCDAAARPGGNIRSERRDGYLCEWGPTGFLDDAPETLDACARLGLSERLTAAGTDADRRFVAAGGTLRELPSGALSFLTSPVLSLGGRLRVLGEPFVAARRDPADESVLQFASRRLGREAATVLVDALVAGVWGGAAESLSMRSAFPGLAALELDHGGIFRGMIARRRKGGVVTRRGRLTSFPGGLEELPAALAERLGERVRLSTSVTNIEPKEGGGYRLSFAGGPSRDATAVVLACPSWRAAPIVAGLDPSLSAELAGIPSAPLAVVHLGFTREDAPGLRGIGFLLPRSEDASVLGALIPSNVFPQRAPDGHVLASVMLGGARNPGLVEAADETLVETACVALRAFAGVRGSPRFSFPIRHVRGIPQYVIGHGDRLKTIAARLLLHPGLLLGGNSYRGIAINSCMAEAPRVAAELAALLR
jgi:oxygen-dependent protoporphyrinogen oxidase